MSIDQKSTSKNPRSTVGTITEIYDYMRLLWARVGRPYCPVCGEPVTKQTPQQIVDQLLELPDGTRFQVLAPVVRGRKGEFVDLFKELTAKGYSRARVDGELVQLSDPPKLGKQFKHTIEVVVDRLVVKEGISQRLTDSVETALGLAEGRVLAEFVDLEADDPRAASGRSPRHLACPNEHPLAIDEIEPRSFSFNNPFGACTACSGIGTKLEVDEELIIPNPELSLVRGRHRAVVARHGHHRVLEPAARTDSPRSSASPWTRRGRSCPPTSGRPCSTARTTRLWCSTATASAGNASTAPASRASCSTSTASTARPIRTRHATATRSTCARFRARPATAPG